MANATTCFLLLLLSIILPRYRSACNVTFFYSDLIEWFSLVNVINVRNVVYVAGYTTASFEQNYHVLLVANYAYLLNLQKSKRYLFQFFDAVIILEVHFGFNNTNSSRNRSFVSWNLQLIHVIFFENKTFLKRKNVIPFFRFIFQCTFNVHLYI